ncbi:MAG: glycine betaine ABC transporter substrate-binding protein [Burkholderiaceae bacterium]
MKISKAISILAAGFVMATASTAVMAQTVVVGGKNFTEQLLMASMTSQLLQAKGFKPDIKAGMGSAVVRQALENGQVDVYWEYTGTSLITYNKVTEKLSAADTYKRVKELDAAKGLVWLNPSNANNTYALAMNADEAKKQGITTISDLAAKIKGGAKLTLASSAEFYARPDGLKPLEQAYGFEFGREDVKRMDSGLLYQALRDKQVNVSVVFATDGRIPAFNLVVLKDDKGFFPTYALTPVVTKKFLDANPKVADILNSLSAKLDDATIARLNATVDVDKKTVEEVAHNFLKQQGLI